MKKLFFIILCLAHILTLSACSYVYRDNRRDWEIAERAEQDHEAELAREHEDALAQAYEEGYNDGLSDGSVEEYVDEETRQANAEQASEMVKGSSTFSDLYYDYAECVLTVTFRDSGKSYEYHDLPVDVWEDFIYSDSLGKYYNANIKGQYASLKIDIEENSSGLSALQALAGVSPDNQSDDYEAENDNGLSALQALADEYSPEQPISTPQPTNSTPKNYRTTW